MNPSPADTIPTTAAHLLREATRPQHLAVEQLAMMQALGEGRLSLAQYRMVLRRHAVILAAFETTHAHWLASLADPLWRYRPRLPSLRRDLAMLGAGADGNAAIAMPDHSVAHRWGMLYVIEGSQLGGRLIARALRARQPQLDGALAYFELGEDDPAAWRRFQQRLDAALDDDERRGDAVAGARAMFSLFHSHFATDLAA